MVSVKLVEVKGDQIDNLGVGTFKKLPSIGERIASFDKEKEIRVYEVLEVHNIDGTKKGKPTVHVKQLDSFDVTIHDLIDDAF